MRVSLVPREAKIGLIMKKKVQEVHLTVSMDEEEKAIVRKLGIEKDFMFHSSMHGSIGVDMEMTVDCMMDGTTWIGRFKNQADAKVWTDDVKAQLQGLKNHLENNAGDLQEETFEL